MRNGLTLPPIVTMGTTGNSGGFTIDPGFKWGKYAIADWQGVGEAIITNDGMTYSLPLCDGSAISSAEMDMLHEWLEMKSGIQAFTYELKMLDRAINYNDASGAIKDLWKLTESDNYLLNNAPIITHAYFKNKLVNFSLADTLAVQQKLDSKEALIRVSSTHPYSLKYEALTPELSGGTFTPVKALTHYLWGNGEKLSVNINNIGLDIKAHEIPLLANTIVSTREAGSYHLLAPKVAYETRFDSAITGAYLGRITLKAEGNFTRHTNGSWTFDGILKAYNDIYDFNESNRPILLETLTSAGRVLSGTRYEIEIPGEHRISLSGTGFQPN
ncbi:lipid II-degrading bacteriocin [Pseudomonas sp. 6D_7.1_Bac1]|uniref:lipid II-degrading bacteriocin n=1 Tax=Pseudomonas sp. 6D_7.1_Bac1 TaxID=2971615 RepID=UPI0021C71DC7|nr:lipid II-degrading bacteriocin [Pseudomonas sp. 6D_7.1_Bac1]MCU1752612.1 lipid II-degrading bacteriocin [Pseudomonas sp. 6D_7.1_Bac1]